MRKITGRILFVLLILVTTRSSAQDPHFSQFFNMPVNYNPAWTGQGVENIRLTGIYRNQWPSLGNAITTQGVQFDKQVSRVGLGILVLKNSAGPASLKRLQLGGTISYRLKFGVHQIAAGLNVGLIQKSFDPSKMTFDDQYLEDIGYSANTPTADIFSFTHVTRPDLGGGILWTMGEGGESKWKPFAGASLIHINKAKEVFILEENFMPIKAVFQAGTKYIVNERVELKPSIMMQHQQFSDEMMAGCMVTLNLEQRNKVEAGIYIRKNEAAIIYGGYQWNSIMVGASYDMNISKSVSGPGAFELSLTYIPVAKEKAKEKKKKERITTEKPENIKKEAKPPLVVEKKVDPVITDRDKDGIADSNDQCPDEAGLSSNRGCPLSDIDADGDGIPNKIDECPYIKGSVTMRGCPDLDDDGVIDSKDHCPTVKGSTVNNGCPDKNTLTKVQDKTKAVEFEVNETAIAGGDLIDILEPITDRLAADTALRVSITGHTDAEGDDQYNMILSQNRADAVRAYFVEHGIAESRIQTIGYGESNPVTANDTEVGRSQNRRAEIYIKKAP